MILRTRVFEFYYGYYHSIFEMAAGMGLSVSHVYRKREGTMPINRKFILGAMKAFPEHTTRRDVFRSDRKPGRDHGNGRGHSICLKISIAKVLNE
ncbi:hypothetical protein ACFLTW_02410 [Chloroflexota bacterium]